MSGRGLLRTLAITGVVMASAAATPAPAGAHAGARAQLYVASLRLAPQADGWLVNAELRDLDSGKPEPGFRVDISGARSAGQAFGPVELGDPSGIGRYQGRLAPASGQWAVNLRAEELPGGNPALPVNKTWSVDLQPGRTVDVIKPSHSDGSSSRSAVPSIALLLGGAAVAGVLAISLSRRRRPMVTTR